MTEECGIVGFFRRVLFKLSGAKIISTIVSCFLIYWIVWAKHRWTAEISDDVTKTAIDAVKVLCLSLLGANVALGMTDTIKGKPFNGDGERKDA